MMSNTPHCSCHCYACLDEQHCGGINVVTWRDGDYVDGVCCWPKPKTEPICTCACLGCLQERHCGEESVAGGVIVGVCEYEPHDWDAEMTEEDDDQNS